MSAPTTAELNREMPVPGLSRLVRTATDHYLLESFQRNISAMLRVLYTLPRTIVLLLQPQDFSQYVTVPDRGLICDLILTNRLV